MKDVGPVMGWVAHGDKINFTGSNKVGPRGSNVSAGSFHARPPNTSKGGNDLKSLDLTTTGKGNGGEEKRREEVMEEMDHDAAGLEAVEENEQASQASTHP